MAKRRVVVVLSGLIMMGAGFGCTPVQETATPPVVLQSGVYEDTLVKTSGGWRFKKRIFKPSNTYEPGMPVGLP